MEKNNCAFQYYDGVRVVSDEDCLTLEEAKKLWDEHYDDMVSKVSDGKDIEVAIWINMKERGMYGESLVHLNAPQVKNGQLWEPRFYGKYN